MQSTFARDDNTHAPPRYDERPAQSATQPVAGTGGTLSITHDLTNDELKRFYGFDFFYDPKPLFGFIPQWIWLIPIVAAIGFFHGLVMMQLPQSGPGRSPCGRRGRDDPDDLDHTLQACGRT